MILFNIAIILIVVILTNDILLYVSEIYQCYN